MPQCPLVVVLTGETEDEVQSSQGLLVLLEEVVAGPTTLEVVVLLLVHSPGPWGRLYELVVVVTGAAGEVVLLEVSPPGP